MAGESGEKPFEQLDVSPSSTVERVRQLAALAGRAIVQELLITAYRLGCAMGGASAPYDGEEGRDVAAVAYEGGYAPEALVFFPSLRQPDEPQA
jgi:hypothetical protein